VAYLQTAQVKIPAYGRDAFLNDGDDALPPSPLAVGVELSAQPGLHITT